MIAEHSVAPQSMLQPERAVQERIVLLRRTQIEPDAPEATPRLQVRAGDVHVVVPDQAAAERGQIHQERRTDDRCPAYKIATPPVLSRARHRTPVRTSPGRRCGS